MNTVLRIYRQHLPSSPPSPEPQRGSLLRAATTGAKLYLIEALADRVGSHFIQTTLDALAGLRKRFLQVRLIFWFQSKRGFIFSCLFHATELKSWGGWGGGGKQKDPPHPVFDNKSSHLDVRAAHRVFGKKIPLHPPLRGLVTGIKSSDSKSLTGVTVQS